MDNVDGCKTIQEVHAFILKHLKNRCNQPCESIQGELWTIIAGFRIDLHCHNVFVNNSTNEYAVHVSSVKLYEHRHAEFPNFGRYHTYSDMMNGFVNKYVELWDISDTIDDFLQKMKSLEKNILDGQRAYVLNSDLFEIHCNFKHKKCFTPPSYTDGSGNYYCYPHGIMVRLR
jgi:hypothetical protein